MILGTGDKFANYHLLHSCGRGGFGEVFWAEEISGRRVALKIFLAEQPNPRELQALHRYVRLPEHPNICRIFHCGEEKGHLFYAMELADNATASSDNSSEEYLPDTLARRLSGGKRLPLNEVLTYCQSLLSALEVIHAAGLVHRDVKPENILFVNGVLKLADFGLLTQSRMTLSFAGTPGYMPPEFSPGKHINPVQMDLYAVGKILYQAVTGMDPMEFPELPHDLPVEVIGRIAMPLSKICSLRPGNRPKSASDVQKLLGFDSTKNSAGWLKRIRGNFLISLQCRQHCGIGGALLALSLVALLSIGWVLATTVRNRREKDFQVLQSECNALLHDIEKVPIQFPEYDRAAVQRTLSESLRKRNLPKLQKTLSQEHATLELAAEERIPAGGDEIAPTERYNAAVELQKFLSSPLFPFLSVERQTEVRNRAQTLSGSSSLSPGLPPLGVDLTPGGWLPNIRWAFVPPGKLEKSRADHPPAVDYPFWIMERPLTNAAYFSCVRDRRNERLPQEATANNLNWNDILFYCRNATRRLQEGGMLLPGYAVRPPTEAEWELAVTGGWNPHENPFDLKEVLTSKKEAVLPDKETLSEEFQRDSMLLRGEVRRDDKSLLECAAASERIYCDTPAVPYSSLRPVIAPTSEGFFERSWFSGPVWRKWSKSEEDKRVWMGTATSYICTNFRALQSLAELLDAHLPEPRSLDELRQIYDGLKILPHYPCYLGAVSRSGMLEWLSNGEKCSIVDLPSSAVNNAASEERALACSGNGRFWTISPRSSRPAMIFEWEKPETFQRRLSFWGEKWPEEKGLLKRISVGDRKYALLRVPCAAYAAESIAELLGTSLAQVKSSAELAELCKVLSREEGTILLGATYRYDVLTWKDGTPAEIPGNLPIVPGGSENHASRQMSGLGILNGELSETQQGKALLLEIP